MNRWAQLNGFFMIFLHLLPTTILVSISILRMKTTNNAFIKLIQTIFNRGFKEGLQMQ